MVFSSILFLTLFLPVVLTVYLALPWKLKNVWLLTASLFFYFWGEPVYGWVMLVSIALNYGMGLWVHRTRHQSSIKLIIGLAIAANLSLLIFFKYAHFLSENFRALGIGFFKVEAIHLPIGISFFTFQAMSYVIDVYRGEGQIQKNPINFGLYIALFPQLIAGPIVRYHDVDRQINQRHITREDFAYGIERFILGLSKKVLIANVLAVPADKVFQLSATELTTPLAWLGLVCYGLQIYFDFSGYSDMAIGLGHMFGFKFLENFNYPYISRSITEFWRRWHISLSSWFRDYLYIPLGGNRKGSWRTFLNLIVVFILCGLWHGASWNFVIWGLFHGAFLVLERSGLFKFLIRIKSLGHFYSLFIVLLAWVFFRAETLEGSINFYRALFGFVSNINLETTLATLLQPLTVIALIAGILASTPLPAKFFNKILIVNPQPSASSRFIGSCLLCLRPICFFSLIIFCMMRLASGTFNPFIYFRF
ncbi:MAG: MBOAT family protein [Verrucomicrobiae bacterium]|nr:MBOAT family protein [Verrucomicrobiae bacterium]